MNLDHHLRPRLTPCALEEKNVVANRLLQITLTDAHDARASLHNPSKPFATRDVPRALQLGHQEDPDAMRVWNTNLPSKVCFFAWLLHHGRLNTRAYLHRRNIRELEHSFCELCPSTLETDSHIFTNCPKAQRVWGILGVQTSQDDCRQPWLIATQAGLPHSVHSVLAEEAMEKKGNEEEKQACRRRRWRRND